MFLEPASELEIPPTSWENRTLHQSLTTPKIIEKNVFPIFCSNPSRSTWSMGNKALATFCQWLHNEKYCHNLQHQWTWCCCFLDLVTASLNSALSKLLSCKISSHTESLERPSLLKYQRMSSLTDCLYTANSEFSRRQIFSLRISSWDIYKSLWKKKKPR